MYREQPSRSYTCNTPSEKKHWHVIGSGADGRTNKEDEYRNLHCPMAPKYIGYRGKYREKDGSSENICGTNIGLKVETIELRRNIRLGGSHNYRRVRF